MKLGALISGLLHAGFILFLIVGLPSALQGPMEPVILPAELLTIDEFTNIQRQPEEEPEEDVAEQPAEPEQEQQLAAVEPPRARPEPEPEEAEIIPAEEEPEPEPVPEPEPEPEPEPVAAKPPPPLPTVRPSVKPDPPKEEFNLDQIAALLDKSREEPSQERPIQDVPNTPPPPPDQAADVSAGLQTAMTMSEIDAFRVQMRRCWNVPAGAAYSEGLIVTVRVFLNPDGTVAREPELIGNQRWSLEQDPFYRTAAESAVRAIKRCQPFQMPVEKYASWRELELTFDPRDMLGR